MSDKFIIYQLLIRVFGNTNENCVPGGSLSLNGSGKFSGITFSVLEEIKNLNVTHIWYTGVIEHTTGSDFSGYGIIPDDPALVKGEAGSPYAIKDYYDVNPYLADNVQERMAEFEDLLGRTHKAGLKAIIDFVPNHLARQYNSDSRPSGIKNFGAEDDPYAAVAGGSVGFFPDNNFYYLPGTRLDLSGITKDSGYTEFPAKVTGNDCFSATPSVNDWYETVKLNYGTDYRGGGEKYFEPVPRTWHMMLDILRFWAAKGADGFRCDMAEMVPAEFWHWAVSRIKREYPEIIFIAEVYNPELYSTYLNYGKFDYLYDKVGLYDNLKIITQSNSGAGGVVNMKGEKREPYSPACSITGNWQALVDMQNSMLNFLENHDEQRIASDFNIGDPFKAVPELVVSLMLNRAPFMLYFGQETGERGMLAEGFSGIDGRTSIFDYCAAPSVVRFLKNSLTGEEKELYAVYKKLFSVAMGERAIKSGDTYDLEYANMDNPGFNPGTQFAFARRSRKSVKNIAAPEELILIAVDFSQPSGGKVKVNLPGHIFDFWNIKQGVEYLCRNLLSGEDFNVSLNPGICFEIPLDKYGAGIIKVNLVKE